MSAKRALGGIAVSANDSGWTEDDVLAIIERVQDPLSKDALKHVARAVYDLQRKMYFVFVATHQFLVHADPELVKAVKRHKEEMERDSNIDESLATVFKLARHLHSAIEPLHNALADLVVQSAEEGWRELPTATDER